MLVRNSHTQGSTWYLYRNAFFSSPIWAYWIYFYCLELQPPYCPSKQNLNLLWGIHSLASALSQHFRSNVDGHFNVSVFSCLQELWICKTPVKNIVFWRRQFYLSQDEKDLAAFTPGKVTMAEGIYSTMTDLENAKMVVYRALVLYKPCCIRHTNILLVFCCLILKNVHLLCFWWEPIVDRGRWRGKSRKKE